MGTILETKRLVLREFVPSDADALALVLCDPETMKYYPASIDRDGIQQWIERNLRRYAEGDHWGQGLATEAAIACREWGFANLKVDRLISLIRPENVPSRRVAERKPDDNLERSGLARLAALRVCGESGMRSRI